MAAVREQSPRALLHAHRRRPQTPPRRARQLAALLARRRSGPARISIRTMRGRDPRLERPFGHLRRQPDTVRSEVDEELNVHLDMRREELKARGVPDDDARREALRQFGDLEATREY